MANLTLLESIVEEVAIELYQKLWNVLPTDQQNDDVSIAIGKNAKETTFFVIQSFMNKFNEAAEELKNK